MCSNLLLYPPRFEWDSQLEMPWGWWEPRLCPQNSGGFASHWELRALGKGAGLSMPHNLPAQRGKMPGRLCFGGDQQKTGLHVPTEGTEVSGTVPREGEFQKWSSDLVDKYQSCN